jgi:glycosyltransferase involved in cell wall biosynthesis
VHLLVVTSLYPTADRPDVGPFVAERVEWLRKTGHHVTLVAATDYRAGALRRHGSMLRQVLAGRSQAIDGVEGHVLFPAGLIAAVAAWLHRVPLLLYAHGSDVAVSAMRSPVHRWLARYAATRANAVVTNSNATAGQVRRLGVEATVIPPGVDMATFAPGDRVEARVAIGLPPGSRVALFLGRVDSGKGADLFADAVTGIPQWTAVLVGAGPLKAELQGSRPAIQFHEPLSHDAVPNWLRAADVVVVPSRAEGLGLAAIEALACGVPVIAARTGGLAEVVDDQVNGRLVEPNNVQAIAGALVDLADDAVRDALASRARVSVAEHDIRSTTDRMASLWSSLVAPT